MAVSKIDWPFWLAMPYVRVWQAVALSLGINPDKMANDSSESWEDCSVPNAGFREEFNKRIRLLAASRSDEQYFKAGISRGTPADHDIQLAPVGNWLKSRGRVPLAKQLLAAIEAASLVPVAPEMQNGIDALDVMPEHPTNSTGMAWIAQARKAGLEIQGKRPGIKRDALAAEVHEILKNANRVGRGGKIPTVATIERRGLKGLTFGGNAPKSSSASTNAPAASKR